MSSIAEQSTTVMLRGAVLRVKEGKEPGQIYEIKGALSIGRHDSSNIFLEDLTVSRFHASIFEDSGSYILKDVSSNGTRVNGQFIKNVTCSLHEGDEIQIGETILFFSRGSN
ncbi:MAG: hypothetical protein NVS4B12_15370 [Ktedonobacteraceae bacterium]